MDEATGTIETLTVDTGEPDAFAKVRAFLPHEWVTDDEILDALNKGKPIGRVTVSRWGKIAKPAFRP